MTTAYLTIEQIAREIWKELGIVWTNDEARTKAKRAKAFVPADIKSHSRLRFVDTPYENGPVELWYEEETDAQKVTIWVTQLGLNPQLCYESKKPDDQVRQRLIQSGDLGHRLLQNPQISTPSYSRLALSHLDGVKDFFVNFIKYEPKS